MDYKSVDSRGGYTLAETLITIMIVGVLSAVVLPILQKATGNKFETMRRKCVLTMEQTVDQMLDDDTMYPQSNMEASIGLAKTTAVRISGVTYQGNTKFCELFASRLNMAPHTKIECEPNKKTFTTADGVDWYLPVANFSTKQKIRIDVNGKAEDPNCSPIDADCEKADLFTFYITPMGKIYPDEECGFKYSSTGDTITEHCSSS